MSLFKTPTIGPKKTTNCGSHYEAVSRSPVSRECRSIHGKILAKPGVRRVQRVHTVAKADAATVCASSTNFHEINQDTLLSYIDENEDTLLVVDFYTWVVKNKHRWHYAICNCCP